MPPLTRLRQTGFRKEGTVRPDAARRFERASLKKANNSIISVLPRSEHDAIEQWAKGAAWWRAHPQLEDADLDDPTQDVTKKAIMPNRGQIVAVKDNFTTSELPTTCASKVLGHFQAPYAASVCEQIEKYGMKVIAKTNMDEFGMGSHSRNSAFGPVLNGDKFEGLSTGGSSGGSAVSVADHLAHVAIGSDTGGSIRLPAAYMNLFGFKPSYGVVSRHGLVPYANSLDTVGIVARTGLDAWIMFRSIREFDERDPTSLSIDTRRRIEDIRRERVRDAMRTGKGPYIHAISHVVQPAPYATSRLRPHPDDSGRKRRIGVPLEYNIEELHPIVRTAWIRTLSLLQNKGHEIVSISLPTTKQALAAYYIIAPAEASSNLAKYDGVRYGAARRRQASKSNPSLNSDSTPHPKERSETLPDDRNGTLYAAHRGELFGDEVKRRILLGTFSLSAGAMDNYFVQAQKVRRLVQDDFNRVFCMAHPLIQGAVPAGKHGVDYIICPTAPTPPPTVRQLDRQTPLDSYINDVFTVPASLAGLPAVSVPVKYAGNVGMRPENAIGIQVIGQYGDDMGTLNFARLEIEPATPATATIKRMLSFKRIH